RTGPAAHSCFYASTAGTPFMPTLTNHRADPLTFVSRAANKLNSLWLAYTYPFASVGKKLSVNRTAEIDRETAHRIRLGHFVILYKHVWLNISAVDEGGEPAIVLEDGCAIGHRTTISAKNCIHLEPNVITGQSVLIMDHSHAYEDIDRPIK